MCCAECQVLYSCSLAERVRSPGTFKLLRPTFHSGLLCNCGQHHDTFIRMESRVTSAFTSRRHVSSIITNYYQLAASDYNLDPSYCLRQSIAGRNNSSTPVREIEHPDVILTSYCAPSLRLSHGRDEHVKGELVRFRDHARGSRPGHTKYVPSTVLTTCVVHL